MLGYIPGHEMEQWLFPAAHNLIEGKVVPAAEPLHEDVVVAVINVRHDHEEYFFPDFGTRRR